MSKLIVETEINGVPDCCGLCDPLYVVVCATKHDQTIDKMMLRVGRPSWCPIVGVLPEQHGRLIDASTIIGIQQDEEDNDVPVTIDDYLGMQIPVPTIVPATEGSE